MDDEGRRGGSWLLLLLPAACCVVPLLVLLGAAVLPAAWAWLTAEALWLVPAAALLVLSGYLLWRRIHPTRCDVQPSDVAGVIARQWLSAQSDARPPQSSSLPTTGRQ
ncbi:MAG: hypothetical protein HY332_19540 [Chloroflexi bacterium]|nr:hypothetical protein [Chloroflexota bacterium]